MKRKLITEIQRKQPRNQRLPQNPVMLTKSRHSISHAFSREHSTRMLNLTRVDLNHTDLTNSPLMHASISIIIVTVSVNGHCRPVTINRSTQTISVNRSGYKHKVCWWRRCCSNCNVGQLGYGTALKQTAWTKLWISKRMQYDIYQALVQELRVEDRNFLRMNLSSFHKLLNKLSSLIRKKDTRICVAAFLLRRD